MTKLIIVLVFVGFNLFVKRVHIESPHICACSYIYIHTRYIDMLP